MLPIKGWGQYFVDKELPLERKEFTIDSVADDEVVVKVAGCGLCHTDLGYISGAVKTKHELPLILGHEISGTVVAAGSDYTNLQNKQVIIPAVLPCGECELCKAGRDNICLAQQMPGNDFNGGFASHIKVPARFVNLCALASSRTSFILDNGYISMLSSKLIFLSRTS